MPKKKASLLDIVEQRYAELLKKPDGDTVPDSEKRSFDEERQLLKDITTFLAVKAKIAPEEEETDGFGELAAQYRGETQRRPRGGKGETPAESFPVGPSATLNS